MQTASHEGPRCQSCAMPMNSQEEFGTEAGGARSTDYCTYCYKNGAFTLQDITMREMCEFCVDSLVARKRMPRARPPRCCGG